jgi:large subunit ribosomal protein L1
MSKAPKRITKNEADIDRSKYYGLADAVKLVKAKANAKFDETIEIAMNLGVDPRHADQMVRGVCTLPNGSGRKVRVGVFAKGAKAEEAKAVLMSSARRPVRDREQGHPGFRPLHCNAGHDGPCWPSCSARSARHDANPKVGTVTMDITAAVKAPRVVQLSSALRSLALSSRPALARQALPKSRLPETSAPLWMQ